MEQKVLGWIAAMHFHRESVRTCSPQCVASMMRDAMPPTSYASIA